jgi:AGCS family alanine or glycine:cation symporter
MMNGLVIAKTNMVQLAFGEAFASLFGAAGYTIGNVFVAICLFFFAFSTIIGWNFFGKVNVEYLFGKIGVKIYSVIALVFIFLGTLTSNDLVWELTDFVNYLMVLPNALALLALSGMVVSAVKTAKKNNPLE